MDKKDFASFCKLAEIFAFLRHSLLSGTALSDTGRCPGQRWVTKKAKQLLNVVSTLSLIHTVNCFSFHDTVLSKLQCHNIFKIPFCITFGLLIHKPKGLYKFFEFYWVTLDAVRDSAEWHWTLSGTALSETGRCPGQRWVKLGAVRDSSEWFEWHRIQLLTFIFNSFFYLKA